MQKCSALILAHSAKRPCGMASWRLIFSAFSLCAFTTLRLCVEIFILPLHTGRLTPAHPPKRHSQNAAADIGELSAALADRSANSAMQKCQFGGSLPHIRLPFRRKYCKLCNFCEFVNQKAMSLHPPLF